MGFTDAQRLAIMNANERAQSEARVAQANRMRRGLGSVASAAGGIVGDYSAAPGMQNPTLTNTAGILGQSILGNATSASNALQRLIALRRSKGYQNELSGGGISTLGGFTAVYDPATATSSSQPVYV